MIYSTNFVLFEKSIPKLHKLINEIFGPLLVAVAIYPKKTHVEGTALKPGSLKRATVMARLNLFRKMFCAIGNFTCVIKHRILLDEVIAKIFRAANAPRCAKAVLFLEPFAPHPFVQVVRGKNRV